MQRSGVGTVRIFNSSFWLELNCDAIESSNAGLTYAGAALTFACLIPGLDVAACGAAGATFAATGVFLTGMDVNHCGKDLKGEPLSPANIGSVQDRSGAASSYDGNWPNHPATATAPALQTAAEAGT